MGMTLNHRLLSNLRRTNVVVHVFRVSRGFLSGYLRGCDRFRRAWRGVGVVWMGGTWLVTRKDIKMTDGEGSS